MKKSILVSFGAGLLVLASCQDSKKKVGSVKKLAPVKEVVIEDMSHNAQNSLDFDGTYVGLLPTGSGSGMNIEIVLTNTSYNKTSSYGQSPKDVFRKSGIFTWDKTGSIITLQDEDAPNQYIVAEGKLIQLDMDGKEITDDMAEQYILKKK